MASLCQEVHQTNRVGAEADLVPLVELRFLRTYYITTICRFQILTTYARSTPYKPPNTINIWRISETGKY